MHRGAGLAVREHRIRRNVLSEIGLEDIRSSSEHRTVQVLKPAHSSGVGHIDDRNPGIPRVLRCGFTYDTIGTRSEGEAVVDHVDVTVRTEEKEPVLLAMREESALDRDVRMFPEAEMESAGTLAGDEAREVREGRGVPTEITVLAPRHPPGIDMHHISRNPMVVESIDQCFHGCLVTVRPA